MWSPPVVTKILRSIRTSLAFVFIPGRKRRRKKLKTCSVANQTKKKITSISNEDVLIWNGNILYTGFMEINGTKECMVIAKSRIQCSHILLYLETPTDQITLFNSSSYLHECNTFNFVPPFIRNLEIRVRHNQLFYQYILVTLDSVLQLHRRRRRFPCSRQHYNISTIPLSFDE